jgi:hypothetical protein
MTMTIQEFTQRFFAQIKHSSKNHELTAQDIKDAIASIGNLETFPIEAIEMVRAYAEAYKLDIEKELANLISATTSRQKEVTEQKQKENIKAAAIRSGECLKDFIDSIDSASIGDIYQKLPGINTTLAELKNSTNINRFPTWDDYNAPWQRETQRTAK